MSDSGTPENSEMHLVIDENRTLSSSDGMKGPDSQRPSRAEILPLAVATTIPVRPSPRAVCSSRGRLRINDLRQPHVRISVRVNDMARSPRRSLTLTYTSSGIIPAIRADWVTLEPEVRATPVSPFRMAEKFFPTPSPSGVIIDVPAIYTFP